MRNKLFLLTASLLAASVLILAACDDTGGTNVIKKTQCKITFNTLGASSATPESITVSRGGTMGSKFPADPVWPTDNFVFYGWWDSGVEYVQDTVVNNDLDLVARWVRRQDTVDVTFNPAPGTINGKTSTPVVMPVLKGESIGLRIPAARQKGYTFDGWFNAAVKYTADAPVINAPVTLTARYTEKPKHTVTFVTVDENYLTDPTKEQCALTPIQVYEGEGLEAQMPGLPGATPVTHDDPRVKWVMWIGDEGELYDEWTPINENMTFHAKWGLDPFIVDLSKTGLVAGAVSAQTPDLIPTYYPATKSIKNELKYDGAENRWYIMYRIVLVDKSDETKSVLPADFNMGYYTRYNVKARFYGNERAILGNPLYSSGYMEEENAIQNVGDEMPPKAGYGQISWCVTPTSNGNPGQDKPGVIAQQYNLGTGNRIGTSGTWNQTWKIGGDYQGSKADAIRPPVLLIQTSDNWIGWIEVTEISFHNGEEEFLPPLEETE
jgi:uncharacterized repeat protein (TIGR02543 family)